MGKRLVDGHKKISYKYDGYHDPDEETFAFDSRKICSFDAQHLCCGKLIPVFPLTFIGTNFAIVNVADFKKLVFVLCGT